MSFCLFLLLFLLLLLSLLLLFFFLRLLGKSAFGQMKW